MKRIFLALLVLMLALMPVQSALAIKVVKPDSDYIYCLDTAKVLSDRTENIIYLSNLAMKSYTGAEVVVVALDSIGGEDIYEYAYTLFNEWGIGSAEENNGFLLLMAIEEDDYYALPGSGIDSIFPASVLTEMYDQYLEPDFAAKNYDEGAYKFFEAVYEKIADHANLLLSVDSVAARYDSGQYQGDAGYDGSDYDYAPEDEGVPGLGTLVTVVCIIALYLAIRFGRQAGGHSGAHHHVIFTSSLRPPHGHAPHHHHGPGHGGFHSSSHRSSFGGRSFGGGTGRSASRSFSSGSRSSVSRSSGRSRSSFGGGRSSGGGAGRGRR